MAIPSRWMDHDVLVWIVMALFSYNNQKKQQQNQYNYNLTLVWHRQAALGGFFGRSGPDNAVLAVMVEQHPASNTFSWCGIILLHRRGRTWIERRRWTFSKDGCKSP
jgi:hypothetical protein